VAGLRSKNRRNFYFIEGFVKMITLSSHLVPPDVCRIILMEGKLCRKQ
jgi:hypothetical protein